MVRNFESAPVDPAVIDGLLALAARAPSAGNTWGTHFVVLDTPDLVARYWDTTMPAPRRTGFAWPGLFRAPALVLPCGDRNAYVDRYAQADKTHTGLGVGAEAWGVPYWHVDTAMATMTLLLAAVDAGLGALFFGLFDHERAICAEFDIPSGVRPIGTVAIGVPAADQRRAHSARRGRPDLGTVVHRGGW